MAVFRVERNKGYTVMSNHHLRNKELSLKAKGLLSQDYALPATGYFPYGSRCLLLFSIPPVIQMTGDAVGPV